jgi:hypothetical protein
MKIHSYDALTMAEMHALVQIIIDRWRDENIPISPGVDDTTFTDFESRFQVRLPDDMREFYSVVNGMGEHYDDQSFSRFWPFEQITPVKEYCGHVLQQNPEVVQDYLFFDHSIDLFMYAIRLTDEDTSTPILRIYPQDAGEIRAAYESFTELIRDYAKNPDHVL